MIPIDRPLILASASRRRCDLLDSIGLAFEQLPADIPEDLHPGEAAEDYVQRLAQEKAAATGSRAPGRCLVLGCDTAVVLESRILGKPRDRAEGSEMLRALSGKEHQVLSGLALFLRPEEKWSVGLSRTRVVFRPIPAAAIESYLDTGEYADKAGAYALQGGAGLFVQRIEGSASNVIGLPLELLPEMLTRLGLWFQES